MIKVNHIDKYFFKNKRNEIHVLNDISIDFPQKGLVVLAGNSGSGKTTFLNVIGGLDTVQKGKIEFDGFEIPAFKNKIWDKIRTNHIGYIFQNYYLLPNVSVYDNVALALRMIGILDEKEIESRVFYMLKTVNMLNFRKRKASQLSGGQMQRVAIARALVKNPSVIIADEPTGNLDSKNTIEVMNIIKKISEQRLVVLVTHERELAKFYGDRIIEMKDGVIVSDQLNVAKKTYEVEQLDQLYLKDFENQKSFGNVKTYTNDHSLDLEKEVSVSLIYHNDCLYLDVKGPIQKVKLITKESGITIKDEHYQQQDKKAFMHTSFDLDALSHQHLEKENRALFSFKDILFEALRRLMILTKRGKIMLIGFLMSGMIVAISAAVLGNYLFNEEVLVDELENHVLFLKHRYNMPKEEFLSFAEGDELFYLNTFTNDRLTIQLPSLTAAGESYQLNGQPSLIDHISESDIIYGRMPENHFEIVVDQKVYDETNGTFSKLMSYGVWHARQLVNERIHIANQIFTIVGISNTRSQRFFASRAGIILLTHGTNTASNSFLPFDLIDEDQIVLTHGRMPIEGRNELLAPSSFSPWINTFRLDEGMTAKYRTYEISGLYDRFSLDFPSTPFLGHVSDIENYLFQMVMGELYIYTSNPQDMLNDLRDAGYVASWPYQNRIIEARNRAAQLLPVLVVSLVVVAFSGLGIYYMMRSSMMSRIQEISVYRALGVKKKDIKQSFLAEVILLTTVSSMLGYAFGISTVYRIQSFTTLSYMFYMNTTTVIIGGIFIYVSNIIFGLLSVEGQLRRAPAELLTQFDI
jgi:putative ABC transport system permease protein